MRRLDDLVDSEPVFKRINDDSLLREHLETCVECRRHAEETEELLTRVAQLPRSLEPGRDLWPEIRERIESRRIVSGRFSSPEARSWSWHQVLGIAAAVVIAVTVVLGYARYFQDSYLQDSYLQDRAQQEPIAEAPTPSLTGAAHAALDAFSTDGGLAAARQELLTAIEARRESLSPQTMAAVMDSLQVIRESISSISTAVQENPDDTRLTHLLASAHRQEIDLLQRAVGLPNEI